MTSNRTGNFSSFFHLSPIGGSNSNASLVLLYLEVPVKVTESSVGRTNTFQPCRQEGGLFRKTGFVVLCTTRPLSKISGHVTCVRTCRGSPFCRSKASDKDLWHTVWRQGQSPVGEGRLGKSSGQPAASGSPHSAEYQTSFLWLNLVGRVGRICLECVKFSL